MAVFVIFIRLDVEVVGLCAAGNGNGLRFGLLLRCDSRHHQFTEFQLRLHTEQTLATRNQRAVERECNITEFNKLQNVILLAFELEFHFILIFEHRFGVVIEIELNLITDFGEGVQLDVFIEVELGDFTLFYGE